MSEVMPETWRGGVARNPYQGAFTRVLCVCSGGILRSPTLAWLLSNEPYNCNTRAAGSHKEFALIAVDQTLLDWASIVFFVNQENFERTVKDYKVRPNRCHVLDIPDRFAYRDPELIATMKAAVDRSGAFDKIYI